MGTSTAPIAGDRGVAAYVSCMRRRTQHPATHVAALDGETCGPADRRRHRLGTLSRAHSSWLRKVCPRPEPAQMRTRRPPDGRRPARPRPAPGRRPGPGLAFRDLLTRSAPRRCPRDRHSVDADVMLSRPRASQSRLRARRATARARRPFHRPRAGPAFRYFVARDSASSSAAPLLTVGPAGRLEDAVAAHCRDTWRARPGAYESALPHPAHATCRAHARPCCGGCRRGLSLLATGEAAVAVRIAVVPSPRSLSPAARRSPMRTGG